MLLNRFVGQHRTVKLKVPRRCCAWCQAQVEITYDKIKDLEQRLTEAENKLNCDRSIQLSKIRSDTASQLFGHIMSFEAQLGGLIVNPKLIEEVIFIVCASVERLVPSSDSTSKNPPFGVGFHGVLANGRLNGASNGHIAQTKP